MSVPDGAPPKVSERPVPAPDRDRKYSYLWNCARELCANPRKHFVLATDADVPGDALARELERRLGGRVVVRARWPEGCKDANDVLVQHGARALFEVIERARAEARNKAGALAQARAEARAAKARASALADAQRQSRGAKHASHRQEDWKEKWKRAFLQKDSPAPRKPRTAAAASEARTRPQQLEQQSQRPWQDVWKEQWERRGNGSSLRRPLADKPSGPAPTSAATMAPTRRAQQSQSPRRVPLPRSQREAALTSRDMPPTQGAGTPPWARGRRKR